MINIYIYDIKRKKSRTKITFKIQIIYLIIINIKFIIILLTYLL